MHYSLYLLHHFHILLKSYLELLCKEFGGGGLALVGCEKQGDWGEIS